MKKKILKHKTKKTKNIKLQKKILKNKSKDKKDKNDKNDNIKKPKEIKIIKKDFYENEEIKNELKDFYLMSEDIYYSDDNDNKEEDKNNFFEEEENSLKINKYKSKKEEKEDINENFIDCLNYEKNSNEYYNDNDLYDDDDDLRFQYNKKIMDIINEDNVEKNKYYENVNANNIIFSHEEKTWSDDPQKLKFNVGDIVVFKNNKNGPTYKICYPSQKENFYVIKESGTLFEREIFGDLLEKAPPRNNKWISYWDLNPIIPAPKNFK